MLIVYIDLWKMTIYNLNIRKYLAKYYKNKRIPKKKEEYYEK